MFNGAVKMVLAAGTAVAIAGAGAVVLPGGQAAGQASCPVKAPATSPPRQCLVMTDFDLDEYVFGALRAGASGFMLKERPPEELLAAIRVIAAGEALLAPNVTRRLIEHFARQPDPLRPPPGALGQLTAREREVLALIATGLSKPGSLPGSS